MTCGAEDKSAMPPRIWSEIEQEVKLLSEDVKKALEANVLWETSRKIACHHDRNVIHQLFNSWSDCDKFLAQDNVHLGKKIAAYVMVEVAERETHSGLKDLFKNSERHGGRFSGYGLVAFAAIDSYHDKMSQAWLLDVTLNVTENNYWMYALQLLRGYETNARVSERIDQVLRATLLQNNKVRSNPRNSALISNLQALLSSFQHASNLQDRKKLPKFRDFESRFWRARTVGQRGFHRVHEEHQVAAQLIETQWRAGDEEFLLWIFENPASTLEELEIAVNLAHRLKKIETPKLKAIADGASRQAPFADRALLVMKRTPQMHSNRKETITYGEPGYLESLEQREDAID